jgi:hypothetical protein
MRVVPNLLKILVWQSGRNSYRSAWLCIEVRRNFDTNHATEALPRNFISNCGCFDRSPRISR